MTNSVSSSAKKLAVVVSHPIQYHVPFYRRIAQEKDLELRVIFASRAGVSSYFDRDMRTELSWNTDLLAGYDHEFLPGADEIKQITVKALDSPGLEQCLADFAPDAVLVYGYATPNARRTMRWARRYDAAVLYQSDSELVHSRSTWRKVLKRLIVPYIFRKIDGFLAIGSRNRDYYLHYGVPDRKVFKTPFTIDQPAFEAAAAKRDIARRALRCQLHLPDDACIALFAGKFAPHKRPIDLLRALERVEREQPGSLHIVFAGDGVLRSELESLTRELNLPAHFLGFVNLDRLPDVYAAADMLILASEIDAYGLVCSEAACCSLPLITSDHVGAVGPEDMARSGENAIVYPCGDVEALADAMIELATSPAKRAAMGDASRAVFSSLDTEASLAGLKRALATCVK